MLQSRTYNHRACLILRRRWLLGLATSVTCTWIMPAFDVPVGITMSSSYTRLRGKHLAEPVPPESHLLMTNTNATLGQQVLDLAQR